MEHPTLSLYATALTTIAVGIAMFTDLRWRRIPNLVTFPAIVAGVVLRSSFQGWEGLAFSICGLLGAPILLVLMHAGRGLGMGDIKLTAAVGSILGPSLSLDTVLFTALAGGVLALASQFCNRGVLATALSTAFIGVPGLRRWAKPNSTEAATAPATIPYAIGIGIGALSTLALYWCTKHDGWFLWRVTGVATS